MNLDNALSLTGTLKAAPVLDRATNARLGVVVNAVVDPVDGVLLALLLRTARENQEVVLERAIRHEAGAFVVSASGDSAESARAVVGIGVLATSLLRALVISDSGTLLGRIQDVWVSPSDRRVFYEVGRTWARRLFGSSRFVAGSATRFFSTGRLVVAVPAGTAPPATLAEVIRSTGR